MNPTLESLMAAYEAEGRRKMGYGKAEACAWAEGKLATQMADLLDIAERLTNDEQADEAYRELRRLRRRIEQVLKAGENDG